MGKVRASVIGDESLEKKAKVKAEKRREAKAVEKGIKVSSTDAKAIADKKELKEAKESRSPRHAELDSASQQIADQVRNDDSVVEVQPQEKTEAPKTASAKSAGEAKKSKHVRGKKYLANAKLVDKEKLYKVADAIELLDKTHLGKFDETVELHVNTQTTGISGQMTLPHGTGKQTRVAIFAPTQDQKGSDALLKEIESGKISFDILVATPDAMAKLAKVAKVLGPKGLMPNPKNGTITAHPEEVAKKFQGGQMYFKTEAKAPIIHLTIGKLSFGKDKLSENIATALGAIKNENIKNVTIKSTMSPGIKLQVK